jgi:hypothetical protein
MTQKVVKFGDKFGLEKDRLKLVKDIFDFDIVRIEIHKSKVLYDTTIEKEDGSKEVKKQRIDVASFDVLYYDDGKPSKEISKFYSTSSPIVENCKEMLLAYDSGDGKGTLKEYVHIDIVMQKASKDAKKNSKNPYLYFT